MPPFLGAESPLGCLSATMIAEAPARVAPKQPVMRNEPQAMEERAERPKGLYHSRFAEGIVAPPQWVGFSVSYNYVVSQIDVDDA